jgi:hypothetical protein
VDERTHLLVTTVNLTDDPQLPKVMPRLLTPIRFSRNPIVPLKHRVQSVVVWTRLVHHSPSRTDSTVRQRQPLYRLTDDLCRD